MTDPNVRQVRLRWTGEGLVFRGGPDGGPVATLDSDAKEGLSSTHYLLFALAGCMAVDVKMILEKSRVPLESLEVEAVGKRAESPPRRFTHIRLTYTVSGPTEEHERRIHKWLYGDDVQEVSPLPDFYKAVRESYGEIASAGGGQSIALGKNQALVQHLLVQAFGAQWEREVSRAARRGAS